MRGSFVAALAAVLTLVVGVPTAGKAQAPAPPAVKETTLQGKVVRVTADGDSFVVQTPAGKEITLHAGAQTRYTLNDRPVQSYDVRPGTNVAAVYDVRDGQFFARTVALANPPVVTPAVPVVPAPAVIAAPREVVVQEAMPAVPADANRVARVHGRIVGLHENPNYLILRTADGREVNLYLDGRQEVTATYATQNGKAVVTTLAAPVILDNRPVAPAPAAAAVTTVEGTVIRVVGPQNQLVVRTPDGREMTVYADPQTVYQLDGVTRITDLQAGTPIVVQYAERDRRPVVRAIRGPRR